jgi:NAD-dependent aldehyde dehydrogenases
MGEACTAANRIFVQASVADAFAEKLAARLGALRVGNGAIEGTDVGPLVEEKALVKVGELVDDAVAKGARVVTGGSRPEGRGYFYSPTVLTNVSPSAQLMTEEIFGPVAPLIPFDTEDDVVAMANDTPWGLAGYLFTQDLDRAFRVGDALEVGMVGLNTGIVSNPAAPFGGIKASGLGREGGRVGIEEFLETKYMAMPRA